MYKFNETVEAAKKYIESNIDENITPEEAAKAANYSLRQLNRTFSLCTGLTISEYIRYSKLSKAFFELKYYDNPIIDIALKYGYESQEGFTRAVKDNFGITPGEYRKTKQPVHVKNWHINQFIHQSAHTVLDKGFCIRKDVETWNVVKPERIWASAKCNSSNLKPNEFYVLCANEGVMNRTAAVPDSITEGGAYFKAGLSFGVELELDYPVKILPDFEIINIPQSEYVVFHCPKYPMENHGDIIFSAWNAQKDYDINSFGLKWDFEKAPIIEEDNEETGYTLWFPVSKIMEGK